MNQSPPKFHLSYQGYLSLRPIHRQSNRKLRLRAQSPRASICHERQKPGHGLCFLPLQPGFLRKRSHDFPLTKECQLTAGLLQNHQVYGSVHDNRHRLLHRPD